MTDQDYSEWQSVSTSAGTFATRYNYRAGSVTVAAGKWGDSHPKGLAPLIINGVEYDVTTVAGVARIGNTMVPTLREDLVSIKRHAEGEPFGGDPTPIARKRIVDAIMGEVLPELDPAMLALAWQAGRDSRAAILREHLAAAQVAADGELARYAAGEPFAAYVVDNEPDWRIAQARY